MPLVYHAPGRYLVRPDTSEGDCGCQDGLRISPPPRLNLHPKHPRALVTVAVGQEARDLLEITGPWMRRYAARVGADFVVLDWAGHPAWPMSAKFAVARVLDHYERVAYVDADVLLRPEAIDLFSLCTPQEYGAVDELAWHRSQPHHGREKGYLDFRRRMGFRNVAHLPWMLNAGVQVVPRRYRYLLLPPRGCIRPHHCAEQDLINARVLDGFLAGEVQLRLLDRRANWQNWTDPGFQSAPADALLHWSGSGGGRNSRVEQIRSRAQHHATAVIIACTPRTGSSLLSETLNDLGIGEAGEWFIEGASTPVCLARMRGQGRRDSWISCKTHGAFLLERPDLASTLARQFPQARYIHLSRMDELAQTVSLVRAQQTGAYSSRDRPEAIPRYDAGQIRAAMADLKRQRAAWETFFVRYRIDPLRLTYEELVSARAATVRRVLAFLGHECGRIPPARLRRQADEVNAEWARRFEAERE